MLIPIDDLSKAKGKEIAVRFPTSSKDSIHFLSHFI